LILFRLASVVSSALWFLATLALAQSLKLSLGMMAFASVVFANLPMLQFLGGSVSYDNFVNLLSVLLVIEFIRFSSKPTAQSAALQGLYLGIGSLAKLTFLPWYLIALPFWVWTLRGPRSRKTFFQSFDKLATRRGAGLLLPLLLVIGLNADLYVNNL